MRIQVAGMTCSSCTGTGAQYAPHASVHAHGTRGRRAGACCGAAVDSALSLRLLPLTGPLSAPTAPPACAVEHALRKVPGVLDAGVNLLTGVAEVR